MQKKEEGMVKEKEGPTGRMRSGQRSYFKSSKLQHCNNDSDIPVGLRKLDSREVGGKSGGNK